MAEKNDDIKNLFLNLGLNPSDYHEIRTAPSANATVSEAPRRWSLLQAAAASKPAAGAAAPASILGAMPPPPQPIFGAPSAIPTAAAPASVRLPPVSAQTAEERETSTRVTNSMAAALFAAASDIARVEAGELPAPAPVPAAPPTIAPSSPADDLRSLFQSVKEPQTVGMMPPPFDNGALTGRRTDQLYGRTPPGSTPAERAAAGQVLMAPPSRLLPDDDAVTRNEPPPPLSRLGPVPSPVAAMQAPAPSPAPAPVQAPAAGEGRLRFAAPAAAPAAGGHGDSLRDVFARLSRENRR